MATEIRFFGKSRFIWILPFAFGCTSYAPRAELWPTIDAAQGAGGNVAAGAGGADTSAGGALGTGGNGGAGGDGVTTTAGGSMSTGTMSTGTGGSGGGGGTIGSGGNGGIAGAGGRGGAGGQADAGSTGSCSLAVTVTTVTANGQYSPRNVGAIWIATNKDAFVKTLALWARQRVSRLTLWNSVTASANLNANTVDAVTSATLSSHQTHKLNWNCTNTSRTAVADGAYRVYFEMTDRNGTGPHTFVDFTKGPMPVSLSPPDQSNFKGISLVFTP